MSEQECFEDGKSSGFGNSQLNESGFEFPRSFKEAEDRENYSDGGLYRGSVSERPSSPNSHDSRLLLEIEK